MAKPLVTQIETTVDPSTGFTLPTSVSLDQNEYQRMQPRQVARNNQTVRASTQSRIAGLANHLAYFKTREFASFGGDVTSIPASSSTRARWLVSNQIGPFADTIVARVVMAAPTASSASPPGAELLVNIGTDTGSGYQASAVGYAYCGPYTGTTPSDVPSEFVVGTIAVDVSGYRGSEFICWLYDLNAGRMLSATVYEISSPGYVTDGYVPANYALGTPIYDVDRSKISEVASAIWKRGRAPFFTWSDARSGRTTNSITYLNLLDNSSTAVSSTSPGPTIDARYFGRASSNSTVPCRLDVYAVIGTGTGTVALMDQTGSALATVSATTSASKFSTTFNLPTTLQKVDVMYKTDSHNMTVYMVSLYPYVS